MKVTVYKSEKPNCLGHGKKRDIRSVDRIEQSLPSVLENPISYQSSTSGYWKDLVEIVCNSKADLCICPI